MAAVTRVTMQWHLSPEAAFADSVGRLWRRAKRWKLPQALVWQHAALLKAAKVASKVAAEEAVPTGKAGRAVGWWREPLGVDGGGCRTAER